MKVRQQIGALPYRAGAEAEAEASLQVLLITSRDTGRWILPKGNPIRGLSPHEAAAQEAWEEAGVRGIPCPVAIGRYSYAKRRRTGRTVPMDVSVFPLNVVELLDNWPERHERTRRWFTPEEAAGLVAETELQQLIAGFRPPAAPSALVQRVLPAFRAGLGRRFPMLGWFQSLMPKQGRFFDLFEAHAATLVAGADALARLLHGEQVERHVAEIVAREHEADDITRDVLQDVRRVFVTPFDRSAITGLIGVMDDAIDQMNKTAGTVTLYGVTGFEPQMRDMAGIIVECARVTAEAIPLLRSLNANAARLNELTERLVSLEGDADRLNEEGLKALFAANREQPMEFIVGREIYRHLEQVADRFEDVANEIQGLVIDHA
ncbi:DUF47 family protein [Sphingomonas aracearum]|uniref:DUF47 family protein n=1 Tax=Sphingomonas aracearum TaxID=2283317 RepID=A0A369VZ48_9SPHN|nr:DUF47 family protein [Sphingomonas aracearum]RDE07079.1 DUF47 family protein [Sphingomonas aracearum]